jgi:UDP-glucose 4-epimerase
MSKIIVTGCAGFIGSHIAKILIDQGHEVVGIDDLSGGFRENVPEGARFMQCSINNESAIKEIFMSFRPDFVVHAAAYAAENLSHFIRRYNYENNVLGSINLINAAVNAGVKCFIFLSSIAVYGGGKFRAGLKGFHEEDEKSPLDPYGIAKLAIEQDLKAAKEMFGMGYVIFRPHNVYGEHQNTADPYRNVVSIFFNQLLQNKPLTIFGDGEQTRSFSYISDVAQPIAASLFKEETWGMTFNIGGDRPCSVKTLATAVARAFTDNSGATEFEIQFLPARHEVLHAHCDHARARRWFGDFMSNVSLEEGLAKMASWVRQVGPQQGQKFGRLDITKNLPPSWAKLQ